MPTYEYRCQKCGHQFEKLQQMSDRPARQCPMCKGKVDRLISSGVGVVIKGGDSNGAGHALSCGKEQTCCGRDIPCEQPPCSD